MSSVLGQRYTVITVDQALYCKLVELKWTVPEYQEKLVVLLSDLHISMCFLKTIGNHMNGLGLAETWVANAFLGQNATERGLSGKAYKRAMRAHKLTAQALWRMLIPSILRFCEKSRILQGKSRICSRRQKALSKKMVFILLNFTRTQQEGNWELFLNSFCSMLPYFFRSPYMITSITQSGVRYSLQR